MSTVAVSVQGWSQELGKQLWSPTWIAGPWFPRDPCCLPGELESGPGLAVGHTYAPMWVADM